MASIMDDLVVRESDARYVRLITMDGRISDAKLSSPDEGSHQSFNENNSIRRSPIQNAGADTPISANTVAKPEKNEFGFNAARIPIGIEMTTESVEMQPIEVAEEIKSLVNTCRNPELKGLNEKNCEWKVNNKPVKFSKTMSFSKKGKYVIEFKMKKGFFLETMATFMKDCESVIEVDLSHFCLSNVIDMNSAFSGCSELKKVNLNGSKTKNVLNFKGLFFECKELSSFTDANFNFKNAAKI